MKTFKNFFVLVAFIVFSSVSAFADTEHVECEKKLRAAEQRAAIAEKRAEEAEKRAAVTNQTENHPQKKTDPKPAQEKQKKRKRVGDDGFYL